MLAKCADTHLPHLTHFTLCCWCLQNKCPKGFKIVFISRLSKTHQVGLMLQFGDTSLATLFYSFSATFTLDFKMVFIVFRIQDASFKNQKVECFLRFLENSLNIKEVLHNK